MSPQMAESERRSANYAPKIWTDDFMQSQTSVYLGEKYLEQAAKLKESVRGMLESATKPLHQLELIDVLQRLGLSRHFNDEIQKILANMHIMITGNDKQKNEHDLYETALQFRLLRQEGYKITQEMFSSFMNEEGNFDVKLCGDTEGLLSLYEASYLSMEDEHILEMAKHFSIHHLKQALKQEIDQNLGEQVSHALEMPLHWRMQRLESRWFIDVYEKRENNNSLILQLAKLDYNIVQAIYLNELKQLSRWHEKINLAEKLDFARSRFAEAFLWGVGFAYEPQFAYLREVTTKSAELITVIDDVYDVHATLDEVQILTNAIDRWDVNAIEELPANYLKICFLALLNFGNEMVYDILQEKGVNILPYVQKMWGNLCKTYLVEARWYHSSHKPSLNEYLENGFVSITGPLNMMQAYVSMPDDPIKMEDLQLLLQYPAIIHHPSLILRLADDLGTSPDEMARGDVPKSIQCYMNETGCCEEDARKHICQVIEETWKKMNKDILMDTHFSRDFIRTALNAARIGQCIYQYGDGHGRPDINKDRIISLFFQPIPLP